MEDITTISKAMARETIMLSLQDVKKKGNLNEGADALKWFNDRHTTPFGYGWCLQQSGMNPNDIRYGIDFYLSLHGVKTK